ncbi:hypothetical protein GH733_015556 [Mirounga leonina]|nr:hypothetical protein GH733_015556 [Mirounga leonina]
MTLLASSWCPRPTPWLWAWRRCPQRQAPGAGPAALPAQPGPGRRALHAHAAALAHLGPAHWPFPEAAGRAAGAAYYAATSAAVAFAARISVCRCGSHGWARAGLAYATVAFAAAAFLLVLAAYVSLARALAAPSGPGPAPAGPHPRAARTMVLGLLLEFALCLAPYHLLLAPWLAGREGAASTLDVLHTLSLALLSLDSCLDPLIYCFSVRRFRRDCWALGCRSGLGAPGGHVASLASRACDTPATLHVACWVEEALERT